MEIETSPSFITPQRRGRYGLGINRRTWQAGQTVGRAIKRWWRTPKVEKARSARKHAARKAVSKGLVTFDGSGKTASYVNLGSGKLSVSPSVIATLASYRFVTNNSFQWTAATGTQGVQDITYFTPTDALTMCAKYGSGANRMLIERYDGEYNLSNVSVAGANVTIYDCLFRKDVSYANAANGTNAWKNGLANEGGTTSSYLTVGATPFESDMFTQFFKVLKTTRIELSPGENHRHTFTMSPNRVLHEEYLNATTFGLAGLSYASVVVFHGSPAHDSTTKSSVTTAPIALDVVEKITYQFKFLAENSVKWYRTNNLATSFAVGEEVFNEAVGQAQNAAGLVPGTLLG